MSLPARLSPLLPTNWRDGIAQWTVAGELQVMSMTR
jgi:hypothetical protein